MSKVVALGAPEELVALVAAGVEVRPCRTGEELEELLESLAGEADVGLVLVAEPVASLNREAVDEARRSGVQVILLVPTLASHQQMSERALSRLLEEAAGADLLAREAEERSDKGSGE